MRVEDLTPYDAVAIRWAEHLLASGRSEESATLIRAAAVSGGVHDECALTSLVSATGATLEEVYEVWDATVYRHGKRVFLTENSCQKSWAPDRPCVLDSEHNGCCKIADVPTKDQRASWEQFLTEMGGVAARAAMPKPKEDQ